MYIQHYITLSPFLIYHLSLVMLKTTACWYCIHGMRPHLKDLCWTEGQTDRDCDTLSSCQS